ncbi:sensor histidine kinase [Bermanella marisrubri]|uniref:histidine kinase n=1 Tax=Bermanella marisrubri TaxID=207949 RepID=Q1N4D0_9GAMM|nr:sensor histidine kinase [Bermanella marisrubri]EAT12935.1 sensor histidine kinase [Oceanobacter sp. RED65] [Bermanella marisrubri]QIZ82934.1 sensor histidine kinase [Bermanella marisrubri]
MPRVLLFFVVLCFNELAWAHDHLVLDRALYSTDKILTIRDALKVSEDHWQPVRTFENQGFSKKEYWLRIQVHNPNIYPISKILRFRYPSHDYVNAYQIDRYGDLVKQWHAGDMMRTPRREIKEKHAAFPVDISALDTQTYYVAIRSTNAMVLDLDVFSLQTYSQVMQYSIMISAMVYGILLVMAFYNFGLAVSIKDKAYYAYVLYVLSFLAFIVIQNGDGGYYLWPECPQFNRYALPVSGLFLILPSLLFPYHLLRIDSHAPRVAITMKGIATFVALCIVSLAFLPITMSITLLNVVSFVCALFMLVVGLYLAYRGVPLAGIYTFAWSLLLVGFIVLPLSSLDVIDNNLFTRNANLIGGVLETVLLSFALSRRIRTERLARLQAVEDSLRAQKEANRNRKSFEHLFQQAPVGIFRFRFNGTLLAVNPMFVKLLGYDNESEVLAKSSEIRKRFRDEIALEQHIKESGQVIDYETIVVRKDGEERICNLTLKQRKELDEDLIEGFITDVTERKQHANMRRLMEEERFSSMEQLVMGVSHEVNTPLGNGLVAVDHMQGVVDKAEDKFLRNKMTKMDFKEWLQDNQSILEILKNSLKSIKQLIQRFRQVSASHMKTDMAHVEMHQHLTDLVDLYQATHPELDIRLHCHSSIKVHTYPAVWHSLLEPLINNSLQHGFTQQENKRIDISLMQLGDDYVWEYRDNGQGIDPHVAEHVFEPFVTTQRGASKHTGLGLYRVYNVVKQVLHGRIDVLKEDGFALQITFNDAKEKTLN